MYRKFDSLTVVPTGSSETRQLAHGSAAEQWFDFGFAVIPIRPGTKATAVKWDPWLTALSRAKIRQHWRNYPVHEVGFIVGDEFLVFDADTPAALVALEAAEVQAGVMPLLINRTKRGQHHFFKRDANALGLPCARYFPKCLDVKTGRTMVVLPPSAGKAVMTMEASRASELSVATQALIDALTGGSRHALAPRASRPPSQTPEVTEPTLRLLQTCLHHLDPDIGYLDWFAVAAALFHTTGGCDGAYAMFDHWSANGKKYKSARETLAVWRYLRLDHPRPRTIATLRYMLEADGHDWLDVCDESVEPFSAVDGEGAR
jgi:hypothetical protein